MDITEAIGDQAGRGKVLYNIGALYLDEQRYDLALASLLLAKGVLGDLQNPLRDVTQKRIDTLHKTLGDEQFTTLLAQIEPQASQIVEQALREPIE